MPREKQRRRIKKGGKLNRIGRRRRRLRYGLAFLLVAGLVFAIQRVNFREALPIGQSSSEWTEATGQFVERISFPADHAPHAAMRERYSYSGHLRGETGELYAFHVQLLQQGGDSGRGTGGLLAHAALLDLRNNKSYSSQLRAPEMLSRGADGGTRFSVGEWSIVSSGARDTIVVNAPDFSINLIAEGGATPLLHAEDGVFIDAKGGEHFRYARPGLTVSGTAGPKGRAGPVGGVAWFEHDWHGTPPETGQRTEIRLQLAEGALLLNVSEPLAAARTITTTLSSDLGERYLADGGQSVAVLESWTSPATGITYPVAWKVEIPTLSLALELRGSMKDAEFDSRATALSAYWRGPVSVKGTHRGVGFVELTGFPAEQ